MEQKQVSTKVSIGEAKANLSVNSASLKSNRSVLKEEASIDKNSNTNIDFKAVSADAKVQVENDSKVEINNDAKVGVIAKVSAAEINLSIDFNAVYQWYVGALNVISRILSPEIETIKR